MALEGRRSALTEASPTCAADVLTTPFLRPQAPEVGGAQLGMRVSLQIELTLEKYLLDTVATCFTSLKLCSLTHRIWISRKVYSLLAIWMSLHSLGPMHANLSITIDLQNGMGVLFVGLHTSRMCQTTRNSGVEGCFKNCNFMSYFYKSNKVLLKDVSSGNVS